MSERLYRLKPYAPLIVRLGLALVFFLFAYQKLSIPEQTSAEIQILLDLGLGSAAAINYYLGLMEMIIALGLVLGVHVRFVSGLAALSLVGILVAFLRKYGASVDPNLYRDVGLLGAALSLWLTGAGPLSWDNWRAKKRRQRNRL